MRTASEAAAFATGGPVNIMSELEKVQAQEDAAIAALERQRVEIQRERERLNQLRAPLETIQRELADIEAQHGRLIPIREGALTAAAEFDSRVQSALLYGSVDGTTYMSVANNWQAELRAKESLPYIEKALAKLDAQAAELREKIKAYKAQHRLA